MKDVVTCDKRRIGGNNLSPGDLRMGQPRPGHAGRLRTEFIGTTELTEGSEISQYLEDKKVNQRYRQ